MTPAAGTGATDPRASTFLNISTVAAARNASPAPAAIPTASAMRSRWLPSSLVAAFAARCASAGVADESVGSTLMLGGLVEPGATLSVTSSLPRPVIPNNAGVTSGLRYLVPLVLMSDRHAWLPAVAGMLTGAVNATPCVQREPTQLAGCACVLDVDCCTVQWASGAHKQRHTCCWCTACSWIRPFQLCGPARLLQWRCQAGAR